MESGKSMTHFEHEIELAFSMLEMCGVPRERARSVRNGIDVLATRYRKQDIAYTELLTRVGQLEIQSARYEKLRKLNPRQYADLWQRNLTGEKRFDEWVDELPM
jgi:hypothetical protein